MGIIEKVLRGSSRYWAVVVTLLVVAGAGVVTYFYQLQTGLHITGMGRDVSWGFYIAQFTFMVGVVASAVMVVAPYYLYKYKVFGRIAILGEFLAVASVIMCGLFIMVDLGQPMRGANVFLYPTPNSPMFWDAVSLGGYLTLNLVIGWFVLSSESKGTPPPTWLKPLIYLSIPWAVSIHTVTAFLYAGLPGRHLWLTAIMAPRFLATAFAAGPSLLILLAFLIRKYTKFDPGKEAFRALGQVVMYGMIANLFFLGMEFFTAFFSQIPAHTHSLGYLFFGLHGHAALAPAMWFSLIIGIIAMLMLINPGTRKNETTLAVAAMMVLVGTWIDKGMGLVVGGFIPNPMGQVVEYTPTAPEIMITIGVYAGGFLILTLLYKIAIGVKEEVAA